MSRRLSSLATFEAGLLHLVERRPVTGARPDGDCMTSLLRSELHDTTRRGMQTFGSADSYEFTLPGWKFIAYPVRASSQTCLACHALRLGDPIGMVMYGYREIRRP